MGQIKHDAASSSETSGRDLTPAGGGAGRAGCEEAWEGSGWSGMAKEPVQPGVLRDETGFGGLASPCSLSEGP